MQHHYGKILDYRDIFVKNIAIFADQCESRRAIMLPAFDAIEKIDFNMSFDECLNQVKSLRDELLGNGLAS